MIPKLVESPNYGKGLRRHLKLLGDDTHFERDFSTRDGTPYNLLNIVLVKSALRHFIVTYPKKKPVLDFLVWGVYPSECCLESGIPGLDIDFLEPLNGRINHLFLAKACSRLTAHDNNSVSNIDSAMS